MIGGKFTPLTIMKEAEEGEDLDTPTGTFPQQPLTAMEILGNTDQRRRRKKITNNILEMCDERRELKNKKHEAQGVGQCRDINGTIKIAMKQAKENWIEEQCREININLKKNSTKQACQIVSTSQLQNKEEEPAPSKTS